MNSYEIRYAGDIYTMKSDYFLVGELGFYFYKDNSNMQVMVSETLGRTDKNHYVSPSKDELIAVVPVGATVRKII